MNDAVDFHRGSLATSRPHAGPDPRRAWPRFELRVLLAYLVSGVIWIIASDWMLQDLVSDPGHLAAAQMAKGIGFVAITGIAIYVALNLHRFAQETTATVPVPSLRRRGRILMAIFLALGLTIAAGGYFVLEDMRESYRAEAYQRLTGVAKLKIQQIDHWLQQKLLDAKLIRDQVDAITLEHARSPDDQLRIVRRFFAAALRRSPDGMGIRLYDENGTVLVEMGETASNGSDFHQDMLEAMSTTGTAILDGRYLGDDVERARIHIGVELASRITEGAGIAFMAFSIDPSVWLFPSIREWPTPSDSAEALVVRRDVDRVAFLSQPRHYTGPLPGPTVSLKDEARPAVQAMFRSAGVYEGLDYREVPVLAAFQSLTSLPWHIVAKADIQEIMRPLHQRTALVTLILVLAISASAVFVLFLWRSQHAYFLADQKREHERRIAVTLHYEQLIRLARDIFLLLDPDGAIVEFNDAALAAYGYSAAELNRMNIRELHAPLDAATLEAQWRTADTPSGGQFESRHRTKAGAVVPVEVSARPMELRGKRYRQCFIRVVTDRKNLEADLRRVARILRAIQLAKSALLRADSESALFGQMCRIVVDAAGYRMACVGIAENDADKTVRVIAVHGVDDGYLEQAGLTWDERPNGSGPSGSAIRTGEVQVNQNFATNPHVAPWRDLAVARGFQSSIALPLKTSEGVFGAFTIYAAHADAFDPDEIELLTALADDISFGVTAIRARTAAGMAAGQLRSTMERAIEVLAETMEARDPYTAGHQVRVAQLSRGIARRMGLAEDRIQGVHLGALIHDIGKISVPAEILAKPGKLSGTEYELIKEHARVGYEIVKNIAFPWPVAEMVRQHHERLDGSGYPDGLVGDAIGVEGRILAVADVVEAMTSHRPYRPALGVGAALDEIAKGRGKTYDAEAVDACLALFREERFEFDSYGR